MTIRAQSADGAIHEFPDDTDMAVVDRAMAAYAGQKNPSVAEDVARTIPAGLARGAAGVAGLPGFLQSGADIAASLPGQAYNYFLGSGRFEDTPSMAAGRAAAPDIGPGRVLTAENATRAIEGVTGPLYRPQTTAGEFANTLAEFAPGAVLGGGTALQRAAQVAVPAATSEVAGQTTRRIAPSLEPAVRTGTALAAGGATALAQRPGTAAGLIREAAPNLDQATVTAARALIDDAAGQGVALTWPEAIQRVTGGATRLADVQRVVENSTGGGAVMRPFMAERPGQVQQAGNQVISSLADTAVDPIQTGIRTQGAAQGALQDVRQARSQQASPYYQAAAGDTVTEPAMRQVLGRLDDIIAQDPTGGELSAAARELRARLIETPAQTGTPASRRPVLGPNGQVLRYETTPAAPGTPEVPRTNVGELDQIYGAARDEFSGPLPLGASGTQARGRRMTGQALDTLDTQLQEASPSLAQGRATYRQATEETVTPAEVGPLGQVAARDQVLEQARALLPNQPAAGVDAAVSQTVRRIVSRDPDAAQNLVRTYAQSVFDEAISNQNQFGGAKFADVIAGNPQQARNLEAAVRALPNGHQRWEGFRRFLDVMEATGERQRIGSATAFNAELQQQLKRGGMVGEAASMAATGGVGYFSRLRRWYDELRMGRNTEALARIFTDPNAEGLLRRLAQEPAGSNRAQALALRLTYLGGTAQGSTPSIEKR